MVVKVVNQIDVLRINPGKVLISSRKCFSEELKKLVLTLILRNLKIYQMICI